MKYEKIIAFTLAEVLITLGIIGVVSAMTIPNLISTHKAIRLRSKFLKTHSTIKQVFQYMGDDGVSMNPEDYDADSFYKVFSQYLKGATDCGNYFDKHYKEPCYMLEKAPENRKYRSLDGKTLAYQKFFDDGQILLNDGTLLLFENPDKGEQGKNLVWIFADLNSASSPPNRLGYDIFAFEMLDGEIRPMGGQGTTYDKDTYCNPNTTNDRNGITCTQKAVENSDYFKNLVKTVK